MKDEEDIIVIGCGNGNDELAQEQEEECGINNVIIGAEERNAMLAVVVVVANDGSVMPKKEGIDNGLKGTFAAGSD